MTGGVGNCLAVTPEPEYGTFNFGPPAVLHISHRFGWMAFVSLNFLNCHGRTVNTTSQFLSGQVEFLATLFYPLTERIWRINSVPVIVSSEDGGKEVPPRCFLWESSVHNRLNISGSCAGKVGEYGLKIELICPLTRTHADPAQPGRYG
jgi:hypothetical protein